MLGQPVSVLIRGSRGFQVDRRGWQGHRHRGVDRHQMLRQLWRRRQIQTSVTRAWPSAAGQPPPWATPGPEFGSTAAISRSTKKPSSIAVLPVAGAGRTGRGLRQAQGMWHDPKRRRSSRIPRTQPIRRGAVDRQLKRPTGPNRVENKPNQCISRRRYHPMSAMVPGFDPHSKLDEVSRVPGQRARRDVAN